MVDVIKDTKTQGLSQTFPLAKGYLQWYWRGGSSIFVLKVLENCVSQQKTHNMLIFQLLYDLNKNNKNKQTITTYETRI